MSQSRLFMSLIMRTVLFFVFGLFFIIIFSMMGFEHAMIEAQKWWPFQALSANIITFIVLRHFLKKEGLTINTVLQLKKGKIRKDVLKAMLYLLISFPFAAIGLYGFSYLLLGDLQPPQVMMQALPIWAAILATILFPISNAFAELPTYMGYAFPRIEKRWGKVVLAILVTGFFLSLQHVSLPIVFGGSYLLWRLFSLFPLAIIVAFIYHKTRNMTPLIIAHFIMDLQMIMYVLLASLGIPVV